MIRQGFHDEDGLAATVYREDGNDYEMLYTDEDKVDMDGKTHFQPHLKPDFNIDLLRSNNYITHFLAVKRSLLDRVGGIRSDFDGAQDYDFILRCAEQAGRSGTFQGSYTTGDATKSRPLRIRFPSSMQWMRENVRSGNI